MKPDNVVLDKVIFFKRQNLSLKIKIKFKDGNAMLTDFGLSREGVLESTSAKSFCGSIAYLGKNMKFII